MIRLIACDIDGTLLPPGEKRLDPIYFDQIDRLAKQGDISDMTVGGYWLSGDGKYVYREVEHSYQDMEYYRGPAGGRQGEIFYHISLYLRGKMDPLDMMINYDRIMKG